MRRLTIATLLFVLIAVPWLVFNYPDKAQYLVDAISSVGNQLAAVVMHKPKTVAGLQSKYNIAAKRGTDKVKVLIVPGHEPNYGGAEFGKLKERDMTVELAENLAQILRNNGRYEVFVTRSADSWSPEFKEYFENEWQNITDWQKSYKREFVNLTRITGAKPMKPVVYHNAVPERVALRLYGITKWANANEVDIVIHVHFNDYPGHPANRPGKYAGFAIYTPEQLYANSTTTRTIAESVFRRLAKYNPVSDFGPESDGIVEEPDLIAVGAYNTADAASMLVEYGYIYEPQFTNDDTRDLALKDLAFQTYLGLQDFFGVGNDHGLAYDTLLLPYNWQKELTKGNRQDKDIFVLQTAFAFGGLYPPENKSRNDCPRTGTFGACTRAALDAFQKRNGIDDEKGEVGQGTLKALNREYGGRVF